MRKWTPLPKASGFIWLPRLLGCPRHPLTTSNTKDGNYGMATQKSVVLPSNSFTDSSTLQLRYLGGDDTISCRPLHKQSQTGILQLLLCAVSDIQFACGLPKWHHKTVVLALPYKLGNSKTMLLDAHAVNAHARTTYMCTEAAVKERKRHFANPFENYGER